MGTENTEGLVGTEQVQGEQGGSLQGQRGPRREAGLPSGASTHTDSGSPGGEPQGLELLSAPQSGLRTGQGYPLLLLKPG